MKKIWKIIIAFLGAVNVVFSILIPISVSLLLISQIGQNLNVLQSSTLLMAGILSSLYRAIKVGFINKSND